MSTPAPLPPIPGEVIDPPRRDPPRVIESAESRADALGVGVGVGYRAYTRFSDARATLLAAGTTYYLFLAMFSIIAFAYGLAAALGAERLASYVTEAVTSAFPDALGEAIDPEDLRDVGQTTSVIGAVGLLYGGAGVVLATSRSLHTIFGAPTDPRRFVAARVRALGWLLLLLPLVLLSYVASTFTANLSDRVLDLLGLDWQHPGPLFAVAAVALTLATNFLVCYLVLGNLGGIRPPRGARLVGAVAGAVALEALKTVMALLVGFTLDKPQYGAVAAPIGVLFVLFLQCATFYAVACLTAAVAEREPQPDAR